MLKHRGLYWRGVVEQSTVETVYLDFAINIKLKFVCISLFNEHAWAVCDVQYSIQNEHFLSILELGSFCSSHYNWILCNDP